MAAIDPPSAGPPPRHSEQAVLRTSIVVTVLVAALGIVFGLLSGSYAIVFDGVYSLFDAAMTVVALLVANLIARSGTGSLQNRRLVERFTMGFWHLEPMVLAMNGLMLLGAAVYALINAIGSFLGGGRELDFGRALAYAVVTVLACTAMAVFDLRANRRLRSELVALDAKAWIMSGAITFALLVAFLAGLAMRGTGLAWMTPYIDPAVLALVCVAIIPVPLGTIRRALADMLLVTPVELKQHVDAVARQVAAQEGFLSHRSYVARVGRGRQIELYFIVPPGQPPRALEAWDALRDRIGDAIGGESPDRWLTIVFTTDTEWAE